jgi:hypothetical protein
MRELFNSKNLKDKVIDPVSKHQVQARFKQTRTLKTIFVSKDYLETKEKFPLNWVENIFVANSKSATFFRYQFCMMPK